jgi:hypothetical protein
MKAKEIPLQNITVAALMELQRHGVKGIIDGTRGFFVLYGRMD